MMILANFCFLLFMFHPSLVYVPYAFLKMIIVLKPCYEVMNHYVLSHHYLFILLYVSFFHIPYIFIFIMI
jgi:hypothetical protein